MPDREKVIKGLEYCSNGWACAMCPYGNEHTTLSECEEPLLRDALELLKESETEYIALGDGEVRRWSCTSCGYVVFGSKVEFKYCPMCGKKVKRDA